MSTPDALIADYLRDLEQATEGLPEPARADLLADVRDHLEEVRSHGSEVEVRDALDRLGSPAEIAASAREAEGIAIGGPGLLPPPPPVANPAGPPGSIPAEPAAPSTSSSTRDSWTVLALLFGPITLGFACALVNRSLLAFGVLLGVVVAWSLLWTSRTWTPGEKLLGTFVWPGGFITPLLAMSVVTSVCTETAVVSGSSGTTQVEQSCEGFSLPLWAGIPTSIVIWLAPVAVGLFLLHRGNRRRANQA